MLDINQQHKTSRITITPFNILDVLKSIKCGKSTYADNMVCQ